jgi:hypothetical protein
VASGFGTAASVAAIVGAIANRRNGNRMLWALRGCYLGDRDNDLALMTFMCLRRRSPGQAGKDYQSGKQRQ